MYIDFLLDIFRSNHNKEAIVWKSDSYSYAWLADTTEHWLKQLSKIGIPEGAIVSLEADFSPNACALMLALIEHKCVIVPLTITVEVKKPEFREISQVEFIIQVNQDDEVTFHHTTVIAAHELLVDLKERKRPGLILFSSGSTGKSKAAVHDLVPLLEKFQLQRHNLRTLTFLLFDHIGGFNTLFYVFSNAGCIVTVQDRSPDAVCEAIEKHQVQLLPTSPTFINLLLFSKAYKRYDLSSLQMVTYGTEVMPESTLSSFSKLFPNVRILQTYGLSEIGIFTLKIQIIKFTLGENWRRRLSNKSGRWLIGGESKIFYAWVLKCTKPIYR